MRFKTISSLLVLTAAAVVTSCSASDQTTAPQIKAPAASAAAKAPAGAKGTPLPAPTKVVPVKRAAPIPVETATATIGALGGRLTLPHAGLTVVVPPGAVLAPTKFSVTNSGTDLAYQFEPHGTNFLVPLIATQDLTKVDDPSLAASFLSSLLSGAPLQVGYYPDPSDDSIITELLNVDLDLRAHTATVLLWHFSGYIFASGRGAF